MFFSTNVCCRIVPACPCYAQSCGGDLAGECKPSQEFRNKDRDDNWSVVEPPLWKIWKSIGMMTYPIYGKIKNVPNHQPAFIICIQRWMVPKIRPCPPKNIKNMCESSMSGRKSYRICWSSAIFPCVGRGDFLLGHFKRQPQYNQKNNRIRSSSKAPEEVAAFSRDSILASPMSW